MAERLGCTVAELLERISSDELTEWAAYFKILNKEQEEADKEANRKSKSSSNGQLGTN